LKEQGGGGAQNQDMRKHTCRLCWRLMLGQVDRIQGKSAILVRVGEDYCWGEWGEDLGAEVEYQARISAVEEEQSAPRRRTQIGCLCGPRRIYAATPWVYRGGDSPPAPARPLPGHGATPSRPRPAPPSSLPGSSAAENPYPNCYDFHIS
jgi:hypothetical protein